MKILLFRSNNIFASRVQKYVSYYNKNKLPYRIIGWDRKCENLQNDNYDFYRYKAGVAVGGFKAVWNHFKWMLFVFNYLKKNNDVTTIHACDLNSAFPAAIYKKYYNRDVTLIFDVCDWYSDNFANHKFLRFCFSKMERFSCTISNEVIICEPERRKQIRFPLIKEPLILPNIPIISNLHLEIVDKYKFFNSNLTFAYFGGFAGGRLLIELLKLAETSKINLLIAGYGSEMIEQECERLNNLPNIKYFGKLSSFDGLMMSYNADAIFASYSTQNLNNVFAAPNKYYEALYLGKPIISNTGTILSDKIEKFDVGFTFDENFASLITLVDSLTIDKLKSKGNNANKLWQSKYSNYLDEFFYNNYSRILK